PEIEQEMMFEVFRYINQVVKMVRPRKLMMIEIDGVSPGAKMKQQCPHWFREPQE
ncbi:hypothetical protein BY996DRAFT_4533984, partial [Phakopsora pachyrhizi]